MTKKKRNVLIKTRKLLCPIKKSHFLVENYKISFSAKTRKIRFLTKTKIRFSAKTENQTPKKKLCFPVKTVKKEIMFFCQNLKNRNNVSTKIQN